MSRLTKSKAAVGGAAIITVGAVGLALSVPVASQASNRPAEVPVAASAEAASMNHAADPVIPNPKPISDADSGSFVSGEAFKNPEVVRSSNGTFQVDLTARSAAVRVAGRLLNARVYEDLKGNPTYTPPVLVVKPGDNVIVNFKNELDGQPSNVHTHGVFVSPVGNSDNIFPTITPGGQMQYNYQLPKDLPPGSNWYHPHMHPIVEEQVFGGMSGFYYVEGLKDLLPSRFKNVQEDYLRFTDVQVVNSKNSAPGKKYAGQSLNSIPYDNIDSGANTTRLVNGQLQPVYTVPAGETRIWHMANMSADIWYNMHITGAKFTVIATDGEPVNSISSANTVDTLFMPPARRFDVLVQFPKAGTYQLETLKMNTGKAGDTYPLTKEMTINVTNTQVEQLKLPSGKFASSTVDYSKNSVAAKRTIVLTENNKGAGAFFINGVQFASVNDINATPVKGTTEEWTFVNKTNEDHPIHIHVNDMQIMSINGVKRTDTGLYDTWKIPHKTSAGPGKVVVRMKFRKFTGSYVFHCHILNHEDNGMMGVVNVTATKTGPVSAGSGGN